MSTFHSITLSLEIGDLDTQEGRENIEDHVKFLFSKVLALDDFREEVKRKRVVFEVSLSPIDYSPVIVDFLSKKGEISKNYLSISSRVELTDPMNDNPM